MAIVASPVPLPLSTAYSVDHELYNHLATLEDANAALNASKATHQIFSKIASLLSSFGQEWGLVLVHGHCTLQPNEKMVHRGRVAEPEIVREGTTVFPTRWMSDGKPFEYTPGYTSEYLDVDLKMICL
ncbi:hypothetical protein D9757_007072 [Collybiopsis confluens]|uniref:Uncharacterized protein n=1 Tax=Collybiopsis confluens TaxID=2823264 RepID=A0A8H5M4R1_9AGAR|nr:hypothetical protein D9757_007072 [Collybiopsis confluens]